VNRERNKKREEKEREREREREKGEERHGKTFKVDRKQFLITPFIYVYYIYRRSIFATAR